MKTIQVGDAAPDFTFAARDGEQARLSDFRGKKVVVLFFYPKDGTSVCTQEACAFRDAFEQFVEAGAVVVGVSADSAQRHDQFAAEHSLPFHLVSDRDGSLRKKFGVSNTLGLVPKRVTFVIDRAGVVRSAFSALMSASPHVEEALRVVGELARDDAASR